jgi:hypothetical protein
VFQNCVPEAQSVQRSSGRIAPKQRETNLELPSSQTKRWSSRRKAAVIVAIRTGILSRLKARQRYMLSDEELTAWEEAFDRRGIPGLRSASLRLYRDKPKPSDGSAPVCERAKR